MKTWPFIPQAQMTETIEFFTAISACRAAEYRACLRKIPRAEYNYEHRLLPAEYSRARELALEIGQDDCYLPIWKEGVRVADIAAHTTTLAIDASKRCYSSYLLVFESIDHFEIVPIQSIGVGTITLNPWVVDAYTRPYVCPVRIAHFQQDFSAEQAAIDRKGRLISHARFRAEATEDVSALAGGPSYPTYKGYKVVTDPVELINGVQDTSGNEGELFDSGLGLSAVHKVRKDSVWSSAQGWTSLDLTALWRLRVWLHQCKGRQGAFWALTQTHMTTVTRDVEIGDTTIQVEAMDLDLHYAVPLDVAIVHSSGVSSFRVSSITDGAAGRQLLHIDASEVAIPVATVDKICVLRLCRFSTDRFDIAHVDGGSSTVVASIVSLPSSEIP